MPDIAGHDDGHTYSGGGADDGGQLRPLGPQDPRAQAGYRLVARIGEGGMGTVYLSHTRGGQPVALKVIRREYARNDEFRRRFQQEVQAARRVQGYHVVPVVDHDTTGDQPWLATTFVPGLPLDEALARYGALPLPTVLQLVGCAAEALRAVHAAGVIHRDLKPSNILLAAGGPWVIDFGIARAADSTQLTRSGGLIGTPQFMSPEHANGLELTPAADLFSLGLIAAVAATGRHPYGEAGAITLATKIANTSIRPPDLSGYPDALRPVLTRCLTADPAVRPSPAELAELCAQAAGRLLRDFSGWLPQPVAAEIVRREAAAKRPPQPEQPPQPPVSGPTMPDPPGFAPPGYQAGPPPGQPPSGFAAPTGFGNGAPGAGVPGAGVPGGGLPGGGLPGGGLPGAGFPGPGQPSLGYGPASVRSESQPGVTPGGRTHKLLVIGGGVLALVLAVTLTYAFTRSGNDGDHDAADSRNTTSAPVTQPSGSPSTGAPGTDTAAPPTATDTTSGSDTADGDYQLKFQDRQLTVRPPNTIGFGPNVDLDTPMVDPNDTLSGGEVEFSYNDDYLTFNTPTGKSASTSPKDCQSAAQANPLPNQVPAQDLVGNDPLIKTGDRLCTVTTSGNLAMWVITGTTPSENYYKTPVYTGKLTLWKMPSQ
ncbi:Serine/threonine protein kinase [Actinacidiphila yanglinensis]|uniref:Serine/threonine protein kinase n=1 Tax=Actinacidiphila yanglinensis TaxID=310779 RepID=A0A1H6CZK7_9ACTN|nr:serine/threonine-protein kinase [Actinacidiphila yanglinensis]SEG78480.1 Serine/threonine protein kinase [Actinacidiphila yanglinensis]